MLFTDALELGKPRRTKEGYLAVRARAARTGHYQYSGHQVDADNKQGLRDQATVNVLRDEATVFDTRAAQSFIGKPVTVDHPAEAVTATNWKDHSRGAIMGALRDGDYLAFDLLLMDANAIADVEAGKRELSNGYAAELEFGDFTAPDGTKCQARQSRITDGNHIAIVVAGRAGPECRISDGGNKLFETCDAATVILNLVDDQEPRTMHILTIDGLKVPNVSDEAKAAIEKLQGQVASITTAKDAAETKAVADAAALVAKDTEIVDLKAKLADAAITPAKLADAAKEYADVQAKAKALGVTVAADADTAAIKKAVVDAKMGDAAKDYTADHIGIAFATLTKDVKAADADVAPLIPLNTTDADKAVTDARAEMLADLRGEKKAA